MKTSFEAFEDLAARARMAPPPPVDATARVMAKLQSRVHREPVDATLAWCTAVALAASVLCAMWGYDAWSTLSDPLNGLLCQTDGVIE